MVKRDRLPGFMSCVYKFIAMLFFLVPLVVLWGLVFKEPIFTDSTNIFGDILAVLFAILVPFAGVAYLKDSNVKRMKYTEALRMNAQDAPVLKLYIEPDGEKFAVPAALTVWMSKGWYIGFSIFWLLVLGIALIVTGSTLNIEGNSWVFIIAWLLLGGIVIGFAGIVLYQRIVVTEQALVVQRGIIRHKMPWEHVRLFALISKDGRYELSGEHKIVRWFQNHPGFSFTTQPVEKRAYQQLADSMLMYIQHRTNLPLRDLR